MALSTISHWKRMPWLSPFNLEVVVLTRLEVDGFKNLVELDVEFGPFTCIAGENAAGKSNLFDAIEFLSFLADHSLMEAAQRVRASSGRQAGDPRDLFWGGWQQAGCSMRLAAEMIVPSAVEDDFGRTAQATITFLRYEVEIGYEPPSGTRRSGHMFLQSESLRHITLRDARKHLRFEHAAKEWRAEVVRGRRTAPFFISTELDSNQTVVRIHQDGGSRGQPKVVALAGSPRTVVGGTTQADDPTVLAARREMQSWRRLALEPSAMRTPDSFNDPAQMSTSGLHLASTLFRVVQSADRGEDVYARIAARLSALTGVRARELRVDVDEVRETLTLMLRGDGPTELPARSLSEGTLRFLALCVLLEDPTVTGLLCMEEPENGIHPANIPEMVDLITELALDPMFPPGVDNPTRQVIVNTHSPNVVQLVRAQDLLFADARPIVRDGETVGSALRIRPMAGTWRATGRAGVFVGKIDLISYLTEPAGAQLRLDILHNGAA